MQSRREILQVAAATAAIIAARGSVGAQAATPLNEAELLAADPVGTVTLIHLADLHGQLMPLYFREPTFNIGVGDAKGVAPHITGRAFLDAYGIAAGSPRAYALADLDFETLAASYGRIGGLAHIATVVESIRASRPGQSLLLDGGDTWTNSFTAMTTRGADMVACMGRLKPDAMTGHWEFTLGEARVKEIVAGLDFPFLAQNIRENEFDEPVFEAYRMFERGGVKIAVIGQALPYTPIANPRWMFPKWSFGIREKDIAATVAKVKAEGAGLVVLLSHNGFDVDRKLAGRVAGIDVILTAHTHDALPQPLKVGRTLLVASGCHGKFVSRLDLDVRGGEIRDFRYRLIPIFADVIRPDAGMAAEIAKFRSTHTAHLAETVGRTEKTLYRRGNFNGTLDDVICDAILRQRDCEIALSPGFRWGTTIPAGAAITREDVYNATAISYPQTYRMKMTGQRLKEVLEDVADNIFNPDPYLQQGGDMVRVGGLSYAIDVGQPIGRRLSNLTVTRTGKAIDPLAEYVVGGWASVTEGVEGPPVWDVVFDHLKQSPTIAGERAPSVKVSG
jgi:S-sulfosulfanyl-L-cysteine sulfohydrolase